MRVIHSKRKTEIKSLAEIQAENDAQAMEEARQASETRERLLAERNEHLKEELGG